MPKQISVAAHLSLEKLEKRYRQAKDGIESRQYQIIWLIAPEKNGRSGANHWLQQNMDICIGKKIQLLRLGEIRQLSIQRSRLQRKNFGFFFGLN
jgi:predicted Ser/Thr protein kinase